MDDNIKAKEKISIKVSKFVENNKELLEETKIFRRKNIEEIDLIESVNYFV